MIQAINMALQVLSWFENLPEDEQPPRKIWWSQELLDKWFDEVKERRESRTGGRKKKSSSYESADDVPMTSNELADQFRNG